MQNAGSPYRARRRSRFVSVAVIYYRLTTKVTIQAVTLILLTRPLFVSPAPTFTFHGEVTEGHSIVKRSDEISVKPRVRYVLVGESFTLACRVLIGDKNSGSYNISSNISKDNICTNSSHNDDSSAKTNSSYGDRINSNKTNQIYDPQRNISWLLPNGHFVFPDICLESANSSIETKRKIDVISQTGDTNDSIATAAKQKIFADWTVADAKMADSGSYFCRSESNPRLTVYDVRVVADARLARPIPTDSQRDHVDQLINPTGQVQSTGVTTHAALSGSQELAYFIRRRSTTTAIGEVWSHCPAPPPAPYQCHVVEKEAERGLSRDLVVVCSSDFVNPAFFKFVLQAAQTSSAGKPGNKNGSATSPTPVLILAEGNQPRFHLNPRTLPPNIMASLSTAAAQDGVTSHGASSISFSGEDQYGGKSQPEVYARLAVCTVHNVLSSAQTCSPAISVNVASLLDKSPQSFGVNRNNDDNDDNSQQPDVVVLALIVLAAVAAVTAAVVVSLLLWKRRRGGCRSGGDEDEGAAMTLAEPPSGTLSGEVNPAGPSVDVTADCDGQGSVDRLSDGLDNSSQLYVSQRETKTSDDFGAYIEMTFRKVQKELGGCPVPRELGSPVERASEAEKMASSNRPPKRRPSCEFRTSIKYETAPKLDISTETPTSIKNEVAPNLDISTERSRLLQNSMNPNIKDRMPPEAVSRYSTETPCSSKIEKKNFLKTRQRMSLASSDFIGTSEGKPCLDSTLSRSKDQRSLSASTVDDEDWLKKWVWLEKSPDVTCADQQALLEKSPSLIPCIDDDQPSNSSIDLLRSPIKVPIIHQRDAEDKCGLLSQQNQMSHFKPIQNQEVSERNLQEKQEQVLAKNAPLSKGDYYKFPNSKPRVTRDLRGADEEQNVPAEGRNEHFTRRVPLYGRDGRFAHSDTQYFPSILHPANPERTDFSETGAKQTKKLNAFSTSRIANEGKSGPFERKGESKT
ncbi:hypothetical protein RRG08_026370 [Elysia crispata]|uniref:Uncharacterized protein n=1 Tax=Elysia crispata TaxID=231223 RepID=A0AAE1AYP9_9GAST|nr:hypothetical protein RRG08_026370 [Elysia crispata]